MGSSKTKQTQKTVQSTQVPQEYQTQLNDLLARYRSVADTPFKAYEGQKVEGLSSREKSAFEGIDAAQGRFNPLVDLASELSMEQGLNPNSPEDVDRFINPYTQYVINNSQQRLQDNYLQNLTQARGNAARSNSFGNSRLGVVEGALGSEFLKGSNEIQYGGLRDAFDRAMQNMLAFNQDKRASINNLLQTASQGQDINYRDLSALTKAGRDERAIGQAERDFEFAEFMREQIDPQQKAAFLAEGVYNYPRDIFTRTTDSTTTTEQSQSPLQVALGLGSLAASFYTGGASGGLSALLGGAGGAASGPPTNIVPQVQYEPSPRYYSGGMSIGNGLYAKGGRVKSSKPKDGIQNLLDVISRAESNYAGNSYDTAFGGVDKYRKITGNRPLTDLTISELQQLQPQFTKQLGSSASGRYQIMRDTLKGLVKELGLSGKEKFDQSMQDKMAMKLLERRGLNKFTSGKMSLEDFQDSIAKEWAGLPNSKGKSPYKGVGLNKGPTIKKDMVANALSALLNPTSKNYMNLAEQETPVENSIAAAREPTQMGNILYNLVSPGEASGSGEEGPQIENVLNSILNEKTAKNSSNSSNGFLQELASLLSSNETPEISNVEPMQIPSQQKVSFASADPRSLFGVYAPVRKFAEGGPVLSGDDFYKGLRQLFGMEQEENTSSTLPMKQTPTNLNFLQQFMSPSQKAPQFVYSGEEQPQETSMRNPVQMGNMMYDLTKDSSFPEQKAPQFELPQAVQFPQPQQARNEYEGVVKNSIANLLKMANMEEYKEQKPENKIFGFDYDPDLFRFGLALLSAGYGKSAAQAIGEAGQTVLSKREEDKNKVKMGKKDYLEELSTKLGLLTQGANLNNSDPDAQLAQLEKRLQLQQVIENQSSDRRLQRDMSLENLKFENRKLLEQIKADNKKNITKQQFDALKTLAQLGDQEATQALKKWGGIVEDMAASDNSEEGEAID